MYAFSLDQNSYIFSLGEEPDFEHLLALAAENFPVDDDKPTRESENHIASFVSPFTSPLTSTGSTPLFPHSPQSNKDSDSDSDSEPEIQSPSDNQGRGENPLYVYPVCG